MDGTTDIPPTPPDTRAISAAAAAANPNHAAGLSTGFAVGAAPTHSTGSTAGAAPTPSTGVVSGLFVTPGPNVGVPSPAAAKVRTGLSKRPLAATTAPKKLAKKRQRAPPPPPPPPPEAQFEVPANAQMVFEEMSPSFNDDTHLSTMGVGSSHRSQTNEAHHDDHEFEVDEGEGIVAKGRACNYTLDEDILLCNTWLNVSMDATVAIDQTKDTYWARMKEYFDARNTSGIVRTDRSLRSRWSVINGDCQKWAAAMSAVDKMNPSGTNEIDRSNIVQNLFRGESKKTKKGKVPKKGRAFVLTHCYEILKHQEKWKGRDGLEVPKKSKATNDAVVLDDDDEEASSDDAKRSPTPNSVAYSKPKRPAGAKQAKDKKGGDDEIKLPMDAIVQARKEANEERKMTEERRVAAEERRLALEEKKLQMDEQNRLMEHEKYLFFMDTSSFDDRQKEYLNLCREQLLVQKRLMVMGGLGGIGAAMGGFRGMGATMGGMVAMGGMNFGSLMGGMGVPSCGIGGMGGMSFGMGAYGGMSGMGGMSAPPGVMGGMGGMSAPPGGMGAYGGMGASDVPPMTTDGAFADSGNTVRVDEEKALEEVEEEGDEEEEEEDET